MILKIWKDFIERKVFSYFILMLIIIFGFVSLWLLPKESSPEVQVPIAIIQTTYFGATALEIELQITNEIESAIKNISGIEKITSTSLQSSSTVVVQFQQGENIDKKIAEVKDEIDKIKTEFSDNVSDPVIKDIKFSDQPIFSFVISSPEIAFGLKKTAENLQEQLESVAGVSKVFYDGLPEQEISILINPEQLKRYNLSLTHIFNLIQQANHKRPIGYIEINNQKYTLNLNTDLKSIQDLKNIPIILKSGDIIYLKNIAQVVKNFKKEEVSSQSYFYFSTEQKKSLVFYISKEAGFNVIKFSDNLNLKLQQLLQKGNILDGIDYKLIFDWGYDAEEDMKDLSKNGLIAVALVFIILLFILGAKNAFITAVSIPISFLLAFIFFYITGNTLNFISLFSMILAIGILVDSNIVMTEGIAKRRSLGLSAEKSAEKTVIDLAGPMIAGTATTIAVFVPLFFLSGVTGDFISTIPFTIVFILIASQFVAIFIVPLLHSSEISFFKNKKIKNINLPKFDFTKLENKYKNTLSYFFEKKYRENIFISIIILFFIFTLFLPFSGLVKTTFFPGGDVPLIFIDLELPKGSSRLDTKNTLNEINNLIKYKNFYTSVVITVGKTSDFDADGSTVGDRMGNILINLKDEQKDFGNNILEDLRIQINQMGMDKFVKVATMEGGPPSGAPIDFDILSNNFSELEQGAILAEKILQNIYGVINIKTGLEKNNTGFELKVNRSKMALYGVLISDLSLILASAVKGVEVLEIKNIDNSFDVILKYDLKRDGKVTDLEKLNPEMLKNIKIRSQQGNYLYLKSFLEILPKNIDSKINRLNNMRSISITAEISKEANLSEIVSQFQEEFEIQNTTTAKIIFGGEFAEQQKSFIETGIAFLGGLALMIGILLFLFNSIRIPLMIVSVVPLAFSGVIIGLFLTGNAISFPSILGFIALSGIIVNNSILLIYIFEKGRKSGVSDMKQNIITGSVSRIRAIILTTITTIAGVTPLIFADAMWAPIAYTIIFGLLFAVILTLIFIPILYHKFYPHKQ